MLDCPPTSVAWPEYISPAIRTILDSCRQRIMASIATVPEEPDSAGAATPVAVMDTQTNQRDMNKEEDRLMTFVRWPSVAPVSAERLARAGFFYSGIGDQVKCFACDNVLDSWNLGDDVMKRHRKAFPDCGFVRGASRNVPYYKSGLESKLHLQLLESMDSGFDRSVSRPTTPCSSIYQSGSRDDIHRSRYNTADSAYRSLHRRSSVFSGGLNNDIPDAMMDGRDMRLEDQRRVSFAKWPISFISPSDLSTAGFFFTGYQDRVKCAFCGGILGMWQLGDNPFTEHHKHFPWCSFLKKGYSSEYSSTQSSPTWNGHGQDVCGLFAAASNAVPLKFPISPYLSDYQARLATFKNWPPNRIQTPEHLSYAGFFYTGVNDNVRCFFCDGGLRCWDPQDEAWQEHAKWFPKCPYLLEIKGVDFVEKIQASMGENLPDPRVESIPTTPVTDEESIVQRALEMGFAQPSVEQALRDRHARNHDAQVHNVEELINGVLEVENKNRRPEGKIPRPVSGLFAKLRSLSRDAEKDASVEKLTEENRILKQQRRCKICLDREVSTVFLPCGHLISCSECAPSLRTCSLCRRGIRGTVKTFLS